MRYSIYYIHFVSLHNINRYNVHKYYLSNAMHAIVAPTVERV